MPSGAGPLCPTEPPPLTVEGDHPVARADGVQEALVDLYPLLRAVRPAELSATLGAAATAVEGRGARLGAGLVEGYLGRLNRQVPRLVEDLRLLRTAPTCATLPSPPYSQANPAPLPWWANRREADDGVAGSHGKYRSAPRYRRAAR